jgi:hypothetical protein
MSKSDAMVALCVVFAWVWAMVGDFAASAAFQVGVFVIAAGRES